MQWNGKRNLYVGEEGMVLLWYEGEKWKVRTTWTKKDYGEEARMIIEVMKDVGL